MIAYIALGVACAAIAGNIITIVIVFRQRREG